MDLKKKMKAFFTFKRRANDGFTLVELIVVIAILAILGGVAIPAYSGYVKKAEEAADEQLLAAVNTAFVSACLANGESNVNRPGEVTVLSVDANGKVTKASNSDKVNETFFIYFADNKDAAFKVNKSYRYDGTEGIFKKTPGNVVVGKYTYGGKDYTLVITEDDQLVYVASDFYEMGVGYVLDQMDNVVVYAGTRVENLGGTEAAFAHVMRDEEFINICNQYPEYATADEATKTKIEMLALTQYTALKSQDRTADELYTQIVSNPGGYQMGEGGLDVVANATMYSLGMVFAETDAGKAAAESLYGSSFDATNPDHIIGLMQEQEMAYDEDGLEMGKTGDNIFGKWLKENEETAKNNIAGFQGAMGMLNDNQENLNTDMLLNAGGYGNAGLVDGMEGLLGSN